MILLALKNSSKSTRSGGGEGGIGWGCVIYCAWSCSSYLTTTCAEAIGLLGNCSAGACLACASFISSEQRGCCPHPHEKPTGAYSFLNDNVVNILLFSH